MSLIKCTECGNQISNEAKACPQCGAKNGTSLLRKLAYGFGGFVFLSFVCARLDQSGSDHRPAAVVNSPVHQAASELQSSMTEAEKIFCGIVSKYAGEYRASQSGGANELILSQLRSERSRELMGAFQGNSARIIESWVGQVSDLGTTGDGFAHVSVRLPCPTEVHLKSWNNAISDVNDGTLLKQDSPAYQALAKLQEGAVVRFSAEVIADRRDTFRESSISEQGSLKSPEYVVRFVSFDVVSK